MTRGDIHKEVGRKTEVGWPEHQAVSESIEEEKSCGYCFL